MVQAVGLLTSTYYFVDHAAGLFASAHLFIEHGTSLFAYFFGELNRRAAGSETQERNLLRLMPGKSKTLRSDAWCSETMWREALGTEARAAGENQRIPGASKPHLMHAQVYHSPAAALRSIGDSDPSITLPQGSAV